MAAVAAMWISKQNGFSNSDSPCHPNASHQVLSQSDFREQMRFEDFQDGHLGGHLRYRNRTILDLIVLGFNDTSTLEGHFVSSPREREKRDRRESRGDEREGQGRKRNRNESEETEEIKTFPLYPYPLHLYKDSRPCPTVSQYQLDAPVM